MKTSMMTATKTMTTTSTMNLWFAMLAWTLAGWECTQAVSSSCYSSWKLQSFRDARLTASVFLSLRSRSPVLCADSCFFLHEGRCHSFSFHRASGTCELSGASTRTDNVTTTPASGWRYYRRKINTNEDLSLYGARHCHYNPCPSGSLNVNGKCYMPYYSNATRSSLCCNQQAAHDSCRAKFGTLARVTSLDLLQKLKDVLTPHPEQKFYVDLKRSTDTWVWKDGSTFNVPADLWMTGQPDNFNNVDGPENCIGIEQDRSFLFNDVPCTLYWAYICQYDHGVYTLW